MTVLTEPDVSEWLTPERVARLLDRRDIGYLIETGLIKSQWRDGSYYVLPEHVTEFQARWGSENA